MCLRRDCATSTCSFTAPPTRTPPRSPRAPRAGGSPPDDDIESAFMADALSTERWIDLLLRRLSLAACLSAGYHILDLLVDACPGIEFRTGAPSVRVGKLGFVAAHTCSLSRIRIAGRKFPHRRCPSKAVLRVPAQNSWLPRGALLMGTRLAHVLTGQGAFAFITASLSNLYLKNLTCTKRRFEAHHLVGLDTSAQGGWLPVRVLAGRKLFS
jgi:hypothetical protein